MSDKEKVEPTDKKENQDGAGVSESVSSGFQPSYVVSQSASSGFLLAQETSKAEDTANLTESLTDKPESGVDKPQGLADKSQSQTDKPQGFADKPDSGTDKLKSLADKPQGLSNKGQGLGIVIPQPAVLPVPAPTEVSPKSPKDGSKRTSLAESEPSTAGVGTMSASISMTQTHDSPRSSISNKHIPMRGKRTSLAESEPSTAGVGTMSASISMTQTHDSPRSSISNKHIRSLKQNSLIDDKGSSLNLSVHKGTSLTSIHSDDSFHQPKHMVISPCNPVGPNPLSNVLQHKQLSGRFSVSPVQNIPGFGSRKRMTSESVRTHTKSETSSVALSNKSPEPDTEIQFQMSDLALHEEEGREEQQRLIEKKTDDEHELPNSYKRGHSVVVKDADQDSVKTLENDDFEDIVYEVDENQKTIQSYFSMNTQDSAMFEHAPLMCGNISFMREKTDMGEQKKHYVSLTSDTEMPVVSDFLRRYWGLRSPKIVLSIISNAEHYKPWKSQKLKDDFQKGIIKAANATSMWIITNGVDAGITKIIGDAVKEYNLEQQNMQLINHLVSDIDLKKRRLPIIGITPKELIPLSQYFDGIEGVQIKIEPGMIHRDFYEFNPDHSHFIIVEDLIKDIPQDSMRCRLEKHFRIKQGNRRIKRLMSIGSDTDDNVINESPENMIPVVGLLVQGTPPNIDHVLFYLTNKMPVIALKGSGGLADLIAYAYEEMQEKGDTDPDYEENILKPDLIKMISRAFPTYFEEMELERFTFRDKILLAVKLSNEAVDGDHSYMTIFNVKGWGSDMKDLDKYILTALFRTEKDETLGLREQLQNDLQLTVDWNRPDLAWEIFQHDFVKVRIDKKMFEQSLIQKDREEFIDLFLSQGVRVHSYLIPKKLKYLFEKAEDREIFVNICLEGVLGIAVSKEHPLGEDFMTVNLNRLMYKLSKIPDFFQPYKNRNADGDIWLDPIVAERRAINYLIIWAVLMNRQKLAKTLWNRCDEPIGVALVCSRMFKELSKYTMEQYRRTELEENAKEFGEMALGTLSICWRDSSLQAYTMLGKHIADFNNKTVIEIAHDAGYIHFLAHPCCQKWLTKTFLGQLQIKELDWGFFRLPYWFKILVSVFLIFPMYIWITFMPQKRKKTYDHLDEELNYGEDDSETDDDEFELGSKPGMEHFGKKVGEIVLKDEELNYCTDDWETDDDEFELGSKPGMEHFGKKPKKPVGKKLKSALLAQQPKDVSFCQKIYLLWTAPITKFWNTQVLYFTYLGLFCLATLWPVCGNQYLDVILWCWTAVIELELVCRVYIKYHKYKTLSLVGNCVDIIMIMIFLVVLLFTRILHMWVSFSNYVQAKTFLCFFLLYFFYRLLGVYLPISSTLGPMLLRFNRMVKHDFVGWVRMFLIFMIAGGVTIQAVIYPNWPLDTELIKRIITRPIYAMFLTQVQDLEGDDSCTNKYRQVSGYCTTGKGNYYKNARNLSSDSDVTEDLEKCPYTSFSAYVITLQYLLICKLVLVTLLFAMFSLTIAKVDKEASELWKFQRYALITDFIERFSLPPPFTVFSFVFMFLQLLQENLRACRNSCRKWSCCCHKKLKIQPPPPFTVFSFVFMFLQLLQENLRACRNSCRKWSCCCHKVDKRKITRHKKSRRILDDTTYWKRVAREYVAGEKAKLDRESLATKQGEILVSMQDDLRSHRKSMKRMNDKVVELERLIQSSRLCLEDIQHKLEKTDVMGITNVKGKFIHIAARQSPYPGTTIARFPVFDKYVPWEVVYDVYDPKTFTLIKSKFPESEIMYVDEDIIELNRKREERLILSEEDSRGMSPLPDFQPKWNSVTIYKESGERREIDRRSWINFDNSPLRYTLDALDIPHLNGTLSPNIKSQERGERREIDRRSWINFDNQPLRYTLDALDIPQNPLGRTGMRGKGNLWRWGPNHVIKAVVTRWRRKHSPVLNTMTDFLYVEGKRVLEFIAVEKDTFMESSFGLPGDVLHGYHAPYSILCKSFLVSVFNEDELAQKIHKFDQAEMIQFFSQFATPLDGDSSSRTSFAVSDVMFPSSMSSKPSSYGLQSYKSESKTSIRVESDLLGFSATLLYKGYLDDPRNTDNAWVEAEVWNFHYDMGDSFDLRLKEESTVKWKEVSPYVKMFGNESVIVQEAARIHDAYH